MFSELENALKYSGKDIYIRNETDKRDLCINRNGSYSVFFRRGDVVKGLYEGYNLDSALKAFLGDRHE